NLVESVFLLHSSTKTAFVGIMTDGSFIFAIL
ncbi:hypothetical protein LCGC14_2895580, partial [marine sediment metagenome]